MKKIIIWSILIFVGFRYGYEYITSDKFQDYADKTKAPWTCKVNNIMGNMCVVMSDYKRAVNYFSKTVARCPEDPAAEEAEFEIAQCYEKLGNNRAAIAAYDAFVEKYKGSRRARTAIRAADILRTS